MNAIAMCGDIWDGVRGWSDSCWGPQYIVSVMFLDNSSLGKLQQCPNLHFFFLSPIVPIQSYPKLFSRLFHKFQNNFP